MARTYRRIALGGSVLSVAALLALATQTTAGADKDKSNDRREREEIHQVYDVGSDARLSLSNLNGSVRIVGWDKDQIDITAVKRARSRDRLDYVEVKVNVDGDHVDIEVDYDKDNQWDGVEGFASVEFEIRVPREARVANVELVNGNIEVEDLRGEVTASSVNGEVTGERMAGRMRLSTVNGNVGVTVASGHGAIDLGSVNGNVSITLPRDVNARVDASTVHGEVHGEIAEGVTHAGKSMDAVIGSGGPRIDLGTVNGDIWIRRGDSEARKSR